MSSESLVLQQLSTLSDPYSGKSITDTANSLDVSVDQGSIKVAAVWPYPIGNFGEGLKSLLKSNLELEFEGFSVEIDLAWKVDAQSIGNNKAALDGVKNIIAVASGKGGVGKSTTTVNLALALASEGARVGILDADIYGPSQGMMLGVDPETRPETIDNQWFKPVMAQGLQTMSMAYLVTEKTPMVWRGPMVSGALQQLIRQTKWDNLDYLMVDMPPGTGDIQLTFSQQVPATGSVIVTTPQDIALLDAKKGIEMFSKVSIPVIGVIENMAVHVCSNCGHEEHIFGEAGGNRIAEEYGTELLGSMPLDLDIRLQCDEGKPVVISDPEGSIAQKYKNAALKMAALTACQSNLDAVMPEIVVSDD